MAEIIRVGDSCVHATPRQDEYTFLVRPDGLQHGDTFLGRLADTAPLIAEELASRADTAWTTINVTWDESPVHRAPAFVVVARGLPLS